MDSDVMFAHDPYTFLKSGPLAGRHLIVQRDAWGNQGRTPLPLTPHGLSLGMRPPFRCATHLALQ